jgi:hypothetical protein
VGRGRKPKLDARQLEEVQRRYAKGESARALAREFDCGAATISRHCSRKAERIKNAASKVVEADKALGELLPVERGLALSLADNMKAMANNLARVAQAGSATAVHLAELARERAKDVKLATPKDGSIVDQGAINDVNALNFAANRAASPALRLAALTQGRELPPDDPEDEPDMSSLSDAELDQLIALQEKTGGA